jgi:hypothetical protein
VLYSNNDISFYKSIKEKSSEYKGTSEMNMTPHALLPCDYCCLYGSMAANNSFHEEVVSIAINGSSPSVTTPIISGTIAMRNSNESMPPDILYTEYRALPVPASMADTPINRNQKYTCRHAPERNDTTAVYGVVDADLSMHCHNTYREE